MHTALIVLTAALAIDGTARGQNWPEYRGPYGNGRSDAVGVPTRWAETGNVLWKTPIHGKGWSSPVVWGNQVWLTTAPEDGRQRYAVCLDRRTGKVVHDVKVFDDPKPAYCHPYNSYASPTAAVEPGRVYVHFGSCGTACLDTATGKVLWSRRDFPCDHFRGPASSPALYRGLVFLHFDGVDRQYVVALDKRTGKTVWKKDRGIDYGNVDGDLKKAYGTPTVMRAAGRVQLVSPAAAATTAYDPLTGAQLWRVYHGGMNASARPVFHGGKVILCSSDGGLGLVAVRADGRGDVTASHIAWKRSKAVPNRSSLLLVDGLLYMVTEAGVVSCVEADTGREVWQGRLRGPLIASPVCAGGHVYLFNRDGSGYVLAAGRNWKVVATNRLDEGCMASPAVGGDSLFVRTLKHLYRIGPKGRGD
jgi:outer membrane protein assembly factor BamB